MAQFADGGLLISGRALSIHWDRKRADGSALLAGWSPRKKAHGLILVTVLFLIFYCGVLIIWRL